MQIKLPKALPLLQSDRIELRTMLPSDNLSLYEIYSDPLVMQYTDEQPFASIATVALMLASVQKLLSEGTSLEWGLVVRSSNALVGTCGLHSFNASLQLAEIGCLMKASAWGHGYMTEALNLLTAYARDVVRLRLLAADVHSENKRAQCLFESLGFDRAGPELWNLRLMPET